LAVTLVAAFASLIRLPVLFESVVDWDESIYLLVADDVLRGRLPYTATFDHKPPVIYFLFAIVDWLAGGDVFGIRVLGTLCVAISGVALWRMAVSLGGTARVGAVIALGYALLCLANGGLATNSELPTLAFAHVAGAFLFAAREFSGGARGARLLASGALFALAFGTRFLAACDALGILALFVATEPAPLWSIRLRRMASVLPLLTLGACLGAATWILPFVLAGQLGRMIEVVVDFNARYAATEAHVAVLSSWLAGLLPLAGCAAAMLALAWLSNSRLEEPGRRLLVGAAIWGATCALQISFTGRYHRHYFLVLGAPLLIALGSLFEPAIASHRRFSGHPLIASVCILTLVILGVLRDYPKPLLRFLRATSAGDVMRDDLPRAVAAFIRRDLPQGERVYVFNYEPILYHLLDVSSPTPYAFSDLLLDTRYPIEALGVDRQAEVARVLANGPQWIVVRDSAAIQTSPLYRELTAGLSHHYAIARRFPVQVTPNVDVVVYRRTR